MSLNCPQAVSKLKAYKQQHQKIQNQFDELLSQAPFLPDVKWDEPFMSSPYYKDITKASKDIFDNLYDAKEDARVKLEELKEISGYNEKQEEQEFSKLTHKQKIDYLYSRCFKSTQDSNQKPKYQQPIPDLRRHELDFLYDNFFYDNALYKKLAEIVTHRDKNTDMLRILDCTPDQIVRSQQELQQAIKNKKEIKAYIGELFLNFFQILPQNIEYIYTKFPEGRIKKMEVTIGGQSKEELIEEMKSQFIVSETADSMLKNSDFAVSKEKESITIIRLKVQDLGFLRSAKTRELFQKAEEVGLEPCSSEMGPQLRKQYLDQPLINGLRIAMKPIAIEDLSGIFLLMCNNLGGLGLDSSWAFLDDRDYDNSWLYRDDVAFHLPKSEA